MALLALVVAACGQYEGVHPVAGPLAQGSPGSLSAPTTTSTLGTGSGAVPGTNTGVPGGTGPTAPGGAGGPGVSAAYTGEVGVKKDSIALAYIYPRAGPYQALTTNFEPAVRSAMRTINDAGGIHGRRLEFIGCDDGYTNASLALACAKSMESQAFGLTTFGLQSSSVIAPYANDHKIATLVGNIDKETALKMRYVFAPSTYLETSATILPSFIKNRLNKGNELIGVIYQTTPQLAVIRHHFKAAAQKLGQKVVIEQPIEENPPSCVNEASNVQNAQAKVVLILSAPVAAARCIQDARTLGFNPTWTGVGASWNFNITNQASGGTTNGIQMIANTRTLESPEGQRYRAATRKYYPNDEDAGSDDLAWVGWGQTFLWAEALRRAGPNLTREGFVRAMESLRGWDGGVFAPLTFGPGDRRCSDLTIAIRAEGLQWRTTDPVWRKSY